jgi:hypothetical protein
MTTSNDLFSLLNQIRDTQLEQAGTIGRMSGQLEGLAGPKGRIEALETTDTRQYWLHAAILPIVLALHSIARKSGLTI